MTNKTPEPKEFTLVDTTNFVCPACGRRYYASTKPGKCPGCGHYIDKDKYR